MDSVERIEIPTPFSIGRVNCYAFTDGELALVDPGPRTGEARDALEAHLEDAGYALADVARILITHPHMDHYGLAEVVREASGAEVVAHRDAVAQLADPDGSFATEQAFFEPFLVSMGVPEALVDTIIGLPEPYVDFREPVTVTRELDDGDRVAVGSGVDLEAVHTPGHAPGSVCFVARGAEAVFTGDHVMMDVSPNPLLTLQPGTDDERTRSLPQYLASLERMERVAATVGHAGHRGTVPDVQARAAEIVEHHHDRKERIAGLIDEAGRTTAYAIMKQMWPDLPATEMFPGMSEVVGHLDLLEDEDRVDVREVDGVREYGLV